MKSEKFLEALGDINERYVEEVRCYKMKKRIGVKWLVAIAACMAIAVSAFPVVKYIEGAAMSSTSHTLSPNLGASGKFTVLENVRHYLAGEVERVGNHTDETDLFDVPEYCFDQSKKGTEASVKIEGVTFTATYNTSQNTDFYNNKTDRYKGKHNGKSFVFGINPETGLCNAFLKDLDEWDESTEKLTREECLTRAYEYLGNYVNDPENYEVIWEKYRDTENGYWFELARIIDGVQTSDKANISVRENGEVYRHLFTSLGELKDVDVSSIDMTALNKAVEVKLDGIYGEFYSYDYDTTEMILTKLADGSYVFDYQAEVNVKETKDSATVRDVCDFVIKIG